MAQDPYLSLAQKYLPGEDDDPYLAIAKRYIKEPLTKGQVARHVGGEFVRGATEVVQASRRGQEMLAERILPEPTLLDAIRGPMGMQGARYLWSKIKDAAPGLDPMQVTPEQLSEGVTDTLGLERQPSMADSFWGTKVPHGLGTSAAALGMSAPFGAVGGLAAAAGMGGITGATSQASMEYDRLLEETGDPDKAWTAFWWNLPIGSLEAVDVLIAGGLGKVAAPLAKAALARKITGIDKKLGGLLKESLLGGLLEGLQEGTSNVLQELVHSRLTEEDLSFLEALAKSTAEFPEGFKVGSVIGVLIGGGGATVRMATREPDHPARREVVERQLKAVEPREAVLRERVEPDEEMAPALEKLREGLGGQEVNLVTAGTEQERFLEERFKEIGLRVGWVQGKERLKLPGVSHKGVVLLDANASTEAQIDALMAHEAQHYLKGRAPEKAEEIRALIQEIDPEGYARAREEAVRLHEEAGVAYDAEDEALSTYIEDMPGYIGLRMRDPELLSRVFERDPGMARRMLDRLIRLLQKAGIKLRTSDQKALDEARSLLSLTEQERRLDPRDARRIADAFVGALEGLPKGERVAVEPEAAAVEEPVAQAEPAAAQPEATAADEPVVEAEPRKPRHAKSYAQAFKDPNYREALIGMASEAGATLEHSGEHGKYWVPRAEWWTRVPGQGSETGAMFSRAEFEAIGKRLKKGKPWVPTARQREVLDFMIREVEWMGVELYRPPTRAEKAAAARAEKEAAAEREAIQREEDLPPNVEVAGVPFAVHRGPPEMPKGRIIGHDINGDPIYEKVERGPVERPGAGLPKPKVTQIGAFDEVGGLFEKQAEERDAGGFAVERKGVFDAKNPPVATRNTFHTGERAVIAWMNADGRIYYDTDATMHGDVFDSFPEIADTIIDGGFIRDGKYVPDQSVGGFGVSESDDPGTAGFVKRAARRANDPRFAVQRPDTPEFRAWFRDSKVVDEKGEPLVVYHGTASKFDVFEQGHPGKKDSGWLGEGFYFTDQPGVANSYSMLKAGDSPNVMPVYLSLKNPAYKEGLSAKEPLMLADLRGDRWRLRQETKRLRALGHDGIIWNPGYKGAPAEYVVFDSSQIKSATGNRGTFDPGNPDIRFAVAREPGTIFDETRSDRLYSGIVNDLERIVQFEKAATTPLEGPETVEQALSLMPGRRFAESEKLDRFYIRPLKAMLRDAKIPPIESTPDRVSASDYLYALHAKQANAVGLERHPKKGPAQSGMLNEDADAILARATDPVYAKLKGWNRRLNKLRLDTLESGWLISPEERAAWETTFGPDYVPLRTAQDPMENLFPQKRGLGVSGKESMRREGRSTKADSPLAFALEASQHAIERKEANRVANMIASLAERNPGLPWRVESDANKIRENEDRLPFKVNGEQRWVVTDDKGLGEAFARLQNPDPGVLKVIDPILSWWHKVIIQWNPVFPLTNIPRDIGVATIRHAIHGDMKAAMSTWREALPAAKGAFQAIREEGAGGYWGDVYRKARDAGALIGWAQQFTFEERIKDFNKAVQPEGKARAFGQLIEDVNRAGELGTRLATFDALTKAGVPVSEAAMRARRVTADFARRGRWAGVYRRLYMFSGANVQGTSEMFASIAKNPSRAARVLGVLIGAGYMNYVMSSLLGDDDEMAKLTESDKARFFGVMIGDKRYGVASPYGFNVFPYLGWKIGEAVHGKFEPRKLAGHIVNASVDAFSPLPQASSVTQALTPTIARPFQEIAENRTFSGAPITPPQSPFDRAPPPHAEQFFKGVNPAARIIGQGLGRLTGGTATTPGEIDWSPEWIEHLAASATGGLGTFAGRTAEFARKVVTGDTEDLRLTDFPLVRPFIQQPPRGADARIFYDNLARIELAENQRKAGEAFDADVYRLRGRVRMAEKRIKVLRDRIDKSDDDAAKREMRERIREIQQQINAAFK